MPRFPPIPPLFLNRMSRLLGEEYLEFDAALHEASCRGLRVNTLKLTPERFQQISPFPLKESVPWCPSAFLLPSSFRLEVDSLEVRNGAPGKHPYHLAGLFYLQDPSAMSAAELLSARPGERILDLAASPGGKTTHLAALMEGRGLLVANEIKTKRVNHLIANVERWGAGNVVITNETPERLADQLGAFFDRVLVDAPCSGEGMFRKDIGARLDWSPELVAGCAIRQMNILRIAAKLVRLGGYLLYSTCTFAPRENEQVVFRFLETSPDFEIIPLPLLPGFMRGRSDWMDLTDRRDALRKTQAALFGSLQGAVRLFPHRITGEGHFVCLMKRVGRLSLNEQPSLNYHTQQIYLTKRLLGLWQQFTQEVLTLDISEDQFHLVGERLFLSVDDLPILCGLRVPMPGVWLGNFKKDRFEPAHPLALFLRKEQARNVLSLPAESKEIAAYLRGENIPSKGLPGWVLVCVDHFPLGWGKRVQGVVKNHYPRGWQLYS